MDESATPVAPPPRPKRRLIILVVAAPLLVIATVAVVVIVLPSVHGKAPTDSTTVVDVLSEPKLTWKYDWVGDNDDDYLNDTPGVVSVGADQALVWPQFDYSAFLETEGWYEGYDEDYAAGYSAGLSYAEAVKQYREDTYPYSVPKPNPNAYLPEGSDEKRGVIDGFAAATAESGVSTPKATKPDFTPTISLVNAGNGEETWSIDLSQAIEGVDFESTYTGYDVPGSNVVAIVASIPTGEEVRYALITLDRSTGEVLSELRTDGPIGVATLEGDIIVAVSDAEGEETQVARYSVGALDGSAKWSATVDGSASLYTAGGYVVAFTEDEGTVLDGSTGKAASFGADANYLTSYYLLGDQLLRVESNDEGAAYDLAGWDESGKETWSATVHADYYEIRDGALFTATTRGAAYSTLQRINPADGSAMWGSAYTKDFDGILGIEGNSLLLASGTKVVVVDVGSGEVRLIQEAGDFYNMYFGSALYYAPSDSGLSAYRYDAEGAVWSLDLRDGETITTLGRHLVLVDADSGTLRGLAP